MELHLRLKLIALFLSSYPVALGGLLINVIVLAIGPKACGFKPGGGR
jgi:hypothetical protein